MTGKVIVSRKKFLQLAQCFCDKMSQFSVKLWDPLLDDNVVSFLNLSSARNFWKDFSREEIFASWLITKISASHRFPTRRLINPFFHQLECLHGYEATIFYYILYSSHQMWHISNYKAFCLPFHSLFHYSVFKAPCLFNITLNMKPRFH